jgi:hypothetical protein
MPKLFASEIIIHDKATGEKTPSASRSTTPPTSRASRSTSPASTTAARQSRCVPAHGARAQPFEVQGVMGGSSSQPSEGRGRRTLTLEFTALRTINVENFSEGATHVGRRCAQGGSARVHRVAPGRGQQDGDQTKSCATSAPASATSCATRQARRVSTTTTCCPWTWATAARCSCWGCARTRPSPSATCACRPMTGQHRRFHAHAPALQTRPPARRPCAAMCAGHGAAARNWPSSWRSLPPARWRCLPVPGRHGGQMASHRWAARHFEFMEKPTCPRPSARARRGAGAHPQRHLFELAQLTRERAGLKPLEPTTRRWPS